MWTSWRRFRARRCSRTRTGLGACHLRHRRARQLARWQRLVHPRRRRHRGYAGQRARRRGRCDGGRAVGLVRCVRRHAVQQRDDPTLGLREIHTCTQVLSHIKLATLRPHSAVHEQTTSLQPPPKGLPICLESPHHLWSNQHVQRSLGLSPRCVTGSGSGQSSFTPGRLPGVERSTRGSTMAG